MAGLRIGINALYLLPGAVGGTEIYLRNLLLGLANIDSPDRYFVFVNQETGTALDIDDSHFQFIRCGVTAEFRPARILFEQFLLPGLLKRHGIDVLLNPGFTTPVVASCPCVSVFHDLQHKRHPEYFRWFDLPFWELLLGLAISRSKVLIAVSRATAKDIERYYPQASSKTVVIRHGVDPKYFQIGERRMGDPAHDDRVDKYILCVSTLHPHKNLGRLMEAFAVFRERHSEFRLVVVGLKGFAAEQLEAHRRKLGLEESVRFTGWVPQDELFDLFEKATAFIAPSEFEGFGMPLSEALAVGLPTASSAIPPFDEIAGPVSARFDPLNPLAIVDAMETIVFDSAFRERAAVSGPAKARNLDWNETARLTLDVLERAAGQSR